jgi:hypothetical protein
MSGEGRDTRMARPTENSPNLSLTIELVLFGSQKGHWVYEAIETICKGPEVELPSGITFHDKEGKIRHDVRVRWWLPEVRTFRETGIVLSGNKKMIPDIALPASNGLSHLPILIGPKTSADLLTVSRRSEERPKGRRSAQSVNTTVQQKGGQNALRFGCQNKVCNCRAPQMSGFRPALTIDAVCIWLSSLRS